MGAGGDAVHHLPLRHLRARRRRRGGGAGYASEYAGQCTRRNGSSLTAILVLMVGVGAALYLVLARFDRAQPTLAAQDGAAAGAA